MLTYIAPWSLQKYVNKGFSHSENHHLLYTIIFICLKIFKCFEMAEVHLSMSVWVRNAQCPLLRVISGQAQIHNENEKCFKSTECQNLCKNKELHWTHTFPKAYCKFNSVPREKHHKGKFHTLPQTLLSGQILAVSAFSEMHLCQSPESAQGHALARMLRLTEWRPAFPESQFSTI